MNLEEKLKQHGFCEVVTFKNYDYESAFIGVTVDNRAVYDYELMIEHIMNLMECSEEEAEDFIEYNVICSLLTLGDEAPIIIRRLFEEGGGINE